MKRAIYTGTFDPFTNGHQDILERALKIFDEVTILVAIPPKKKTFLTVQERMDTLNEMYKAEKNVKIDSWEGLVVDYAKQEGISYIVRGLRPTGDFENEFQMASMNRSLCSDIETLFLMTDSENFYVSSSLVKEIFSHGGDVSSFVPPEVLKRLKK